MMDPEAYALRAKEFALELERLGVAGAACALFDATPPRLCWYIGSSLLAVADARVVATDMVGSQTVAASWCHPSRGPERVGRVDGIPDRIHYASAKEVWAFAARIAASTGARYLVAVPGALDHVDYYATSAPRPPDASVATLPHDVGDAAFEYTRRMGALDQKLASLGVAPGAHVGFESEPPRLVWWVDRQPRASAAAGLVATTHPESLPSSSRGRVVAAAWLLRTPRRNRVGVVVGYPNQLPIATDDDAWRFAAGVGRAVGAESLVCVRGSLLQYYALFETPHPPRPPSPEH